LSATLTIISVHKLPHITGAVGSRCEDDFMGNEQMLTAGVLTNEDVSESVNQRLEMIEMALHDGDLVAAQRHLRSTRLWLVDAAGESTSPSMVGGVALTGQEMASLRLLPDGSMSQKDMARAMGVTRNTLKTHLKSLYLKLGAHCRAEAIDRAREIGLLRRPLTIVPTSALNRIDSVMSA
jgi:ATP/maltotriose-dependent transcriptional regulator MalT